LSAAATGSDKPVARPISAGASKADQDRARRIKPFAAPGHIYGLREVGRHPHQSDFFSAPARFRFFHGAVSARSSRQKEVQMTKAKDAAALRLAPLDTPTDLRANAVPEISGALNIVLADMFALYLKTKNFHWHMSGPHFRDYHLLLDEQSEQIFATTDDIAERVRKIGGTTLRSIGQIGRLQRVLDNDADFVTPLDMLAELRDDNKQLAASLRETHAICDEHNDVASASLIENWIDEAERRTWFLFEATRVPRE
jgi:starvation-inducible DNA-binding protein